MQSWGTSHCTTPPYQSKTKIWDQARLSYITSRMRAGMSSISRLLGTFPTASPQGLIFPPKLCLIPQSSGSFNRLSLSTTVREEQDCIQFSMRKGSLGSTRWQDSQRKNTFRPQLRDFVLTQICSLSLFLKTFLFCLGVQAINRVLTVSDEQGRDSAIRNCIHSPLNSPPIQAAT